MTSKTWATMSEAEKDRDRAKLRKTVGEIRASGAIDSHLDRLAVNLADACLMADRIELGVAILIVAGLDKHGLSDAAVGALVQTQAAFERLAHLRTLDPERN